GFRPDRTSTFFADVTGDGKADAISLIASIPYNYLEVRRSDGTGFLPAERWTPGPDGFRPDRTSTVFADVTGDGKADAISLIASIPFNYLEVRRSAGTGFLPSLRYALPLYGFRPDRTSTFFADVTGDGKADAISLIASIPFNYLEVRRSDGTGFLPAER